LHPRSQGLTLPGSSDPCLICSSNMVILARALHVFASKGGAVMFVQQQRTSPLVRPGHLLAEGPGFKSPFWLIKRGPNFPFADVDQIRPRTS
jgi:hypothetical protein